MATENLVATRINNGQSEIWFATQPEKRKIVATNGIVYPIRTMCSAEEAEAFHKAFSEGPATIPAAIYEKLISDMRLGFQTAVG